MGGRNRWQKVAIVAIVLGTAAMVRAQDVAAPAGSELRSAPVQHAEAAGRRITRPGRAAPESDGSGSTVAPRPKNGSWSNGGLLLLVIVLAAFGALFWRRQSQARVAWLPRDAVDVLGRRPLDPRMTLWLVRLGSRVLVLGSSPAGLSTLAEVNDPVEVDLLAGACRRSNPEAETAASGYRGLFDRAAAPAGAEPEEIVAESAPAAPRASTEPFARRFQRPGETAREARRAV